MKHYTHVTSEGTEDKKIRKFAEHIVKEPRVIPRYLIPKPWSQLFHTVKIYCQIGVKQMLTLDVDGPVQNEIMEWLE